MIPSDNQPSLDPNDALRFQRLVDGVRDYAIYMLSPEGLVSSWNTGAQRFKGYLPNEIIGTHFSAFYTAKDRAAGVPARALQTARDEGKFEDEGWRVRKDGTQFWASVVIDPIRDESGTLIGFAKVTRDITERKMAREALRASEERFRLLVQGVTDYALYMLSPEGLVSNWNAGAERIKGYKEHEIVGRHFSCFYTPEDVQKGLPARTLSIAETQQRFEQESWRMRKDGTTFWAHVVVDAIRDDTGKLIGFAKVTRDITERKLAAEALERANAALFQSQKLEAIGQLTGGVAHDFNNLLAVMSTSVDVLLMRLHEHADVKILDGMRRAIERGATLTQQLLSFARQQPLKIENHNLGALIAAFEPVLQRVGDSSIAFQFVRESGLKIVAIDAARFESALLNLVVNARDAMPDGGKIVVSAENATLPEHAAGSLPPGSYVKVSVRDSGTGMSEAVIARAFEPFFTTKEVGRGTGLGLSQVYGFTAQSGGEVILESELGKGTTVNLYLPAISDDVSASGPQAVDRGNDTETVLIVEDEPDVMDAAAALFRSIGYQVLTATNGAEALEILRDGPSVDVLFTDVVMPNGMTGIELARSTRQLCPDVKIVLASGYPLRALHEQHGDIDEFTFVNKPYRLAELAKKLRAAA